MRLVYQTSFTAPYGDTYVDKNATAVPRVGDGVEMRINGKPETRLRVDYVRWRPYANEAVVFVGWA